MSIESEKRFQACLAVTLEWEGGYSNDAHDPGGATNKGIIQREYDAWRDAQKLPRRGVLHIGDAEVSTIYRDEYWTKAGCDALPGGFDLAVFDAAVNNGVNRALEWERGITRFNNQVERIDAFMD